MIAALLSGVVMTKNESLVVKEKLNKRYYSIGEVAEMLDVSTSLLRFWEGEFPQINPRKLKGGKRLYTPAQIETIQAIYILTKQRGYTLEGAKKSINKFKIRKEQIKTLQGDLTKLLSKINELRAKLD